MDPLIDQDSIVLAYCTEHKEQMRTVYHTNVLAQGRQITNKSDVLLVYLVHEADGHVENAVAAQIAACFYHRPEPLHLRPRRDMPRPEWEARSTIFAVGWLQSTVGNKGRTDLPIHGEPQRAFLLLRSTPYEALLIASTTERPG